MTQVKTNGEAVRELLNLSGSRVLDVGCGDGNLVRLMTREGANCTGVDCNPLQLEKARASEAAGDEVYVEGVGEALPFDDAAFDLVVIFNSLHHVPSADMVGAIREAARVLKAGGTFAVFEPVAAGPHFELNQPVDDETVVRDQAYAALRAAPDFGLKPGRELEYLNPVPYPTFEAFKERCIRIDPGRAGLFAELESDLRQRFDSLGKPGDKGQIFDQPMRVNLFEKL